MYYAYAVILEVQAFFFYLRNVISLVKTQHLQVMNTIYVCAVNGMVTFLWLLEIMRCL